MMYAERDYFPRSMNMYVPGAQYASDVVHGAPHTVSFGTPAAADADGLKTAYDDGTAGSTTDFNGAIGDTADARYGRNVTIAGTGATVYTIKGRDYLGQPMTETITLDTGAGTGKKAFKQISEVSWDATGGGADTTLGWGATLGVPYKASSVLTEQLDGVVSGTLGTLVAPVMTDPQTATTGDPRGTYTPNATLTGSAELTAQFTFNGYVNSDDNGGLYGIAHYYA